MTQWQYTLDLQDLWALPEDDRDLADIARTIAKRIQGALFYEKFPEERTALDFICAHFTRFATRADAGEFESTPEENGAFNYCLGLLYDWGDRDKRLWIATTF